MRVVFLDFDGVLNSEDWHRRGGEPLSEKLDPKAVAALNAITERSGAKIVVSSTWRILHDDENLCRILAENGVVADIIGSTPVLGRNDLRAPWVKEPGERPSERGDEIQAWLDEHPECGQAVILDDDSDMRHLADLLVQTDYRHGLTMEHVSAALEVLGVPGGRR